MLQSVSGQALEHLVVPKTQLSYSLMPAKKNDNTLWVPYIATFSNNPTVPPMSTLHTTCVTCGSTLLCTLYRQTIGKIQLVQELLIWPACLSTAVNFFLSIDSRRTLHHLLWLSGSFSDHSCPSPSCPTHPY